MHWQGQIKTLALIQMFDIFCDHLLHLFEFFNDFQTCTTGGCLFKVFLTFKKREIPKNIFLPIYQQFFPLMHFPINIGCRILHLRQRKLVLKPVPKLVPEQCHVHLCGQSSQCPVL